MIAPSVSLILVPLKLKPFYFGDEPLREGETVGVQCVISAGDLPANMSWRFNDKLLKPEETISIVQMNSKITSLSIEPVTATNAGNYTCVAENIVGTITHTSRLFINGLSCAGVIIII